MDLLAWLGIVGASGLAAAVRWMNRFARAQRLLRFCPGAPLDIVIPRMRGEAALERRGELDGTLANVGNLRASALLAERTASLRLRKPTRVHVSGSITTELHEDLAVLGGYPGNPIMLKLVKVAAEELGLAIGVNEDDDHDNRMWLGEVEISYDWEEEAANKAPSSDFGLLVIHRNPFAPTWRRGIVCTGFTSYGVLATAAQLSTHELLSRVVSPRRRTRLSRRPQSSATLFRFEFNGDSCISAEIVAHHHTVVRKAR